MSQINSWYPIRILPNYNVLMAVFRLLEHHIPTTYRSSLSKFQQLILTLIKLRLSLSAQDKQSTITATRVPKFVRKLIGIVFLNSSLSGQQIRGFSLAFIMSTIFPITDRSLLSKFQQLILTLIKLRLSLSVQDISYRFKVSIYQSLYGSSLA
jgi:hypothetical protein